MPLTVFDIKGAPGNRRERIEAAVVAGGRHARGPHEAWIAADPFQGGFCVLITVPQGFERSVAFAIRTSTRKYAFSGVTWATGRPPAVSKLPSAFTPAVIVDHSERGRSWRRSGSDIW
jgi:hypothetical protein